MSGDVIQPLCVAATLFGGVLAAWFIGAPSILLMACFGLLTSIAVGIWRLVERP